MATLADSFLEELLELADEEEEEQQRSSSLSYDASAIKSGLEVDDDDAAPIPDAVERWKLGTADGQRRSGPAAASDNISDLTSDKTFVDFVADLRQRTAATLALRTNSNSGQVSDSSMLSDPSEKKEVGATIDVSIDALLARCNQAVTSLDTDILNIYSLIKELYKKRFPELDAIVPSPLEYISCVLRLGNDTGDAINIQLNDILPVTASMAVIVASSMTTGAPLSSSELDRVLTACREALLLAEYRRDVLLFLESQMDTLAPNIAAVVGAALAAKLVVHAGGLDALARMPAQNIALIGSTGNTVRTGGSGGRSGPARGVLALCDIITNVPASYQNKALRLLSSKLGLAARVDSFKESRDGTQGRLLREQIVASLVKAQEPPPAPLKKALPIPGDGPKRRRGGKRWRKLKEKYGVSELQKQANRMPFGMEAEVEADQTRGEGLGMLGLEGSGKGRLRLQAKQAKLQLRQNKKRGGGTRTIISAPGGATVIPSVT